MWDEVKSSGSRRITSSLTRRCTMKGNGAESKIPPTRKSPNNFKVRVSNPKEISSRKGFLSKGANPRAVLVGMSQPHFEGSVRSPLTLPKMGLGSPLGLIKTQNSIAGGQASCIEVFFIPLERS